MDEARGLLADMRADGVPPDVWTWATLINGYAHTATLKYPADDAHIRPVG
jgi:hypothetical protein